MIQRINLQKIKLNKLNNHNIMLHDFHTPIKLFWYRFRIPPSKSTYLTIQYTLVHNIYSQNGEQHIFHYDGKYSLLIPL